MQQIKFQQKKIYDGVNACREGNLKDCISVNSKIGDKIEVAENTEKIYKILKEIAK